MVSLVLWSQGFPVIQHSSLGIATPRSPDKVAQSGVEQRGRRVIILPNMVFEVQKINVFTVPGCEFPTSTLRVRDWRAWAGPGACPEQGGSGPPSSRGCLEALFPGRRLRSPTAHSQPPPPRAARWTPGRDRSRPMHRRFAGSGHSAFKKLPSPQPASRTGPTGVEKIGKVPALVAGR